MDWTYLDCDKQPFSLLPSYLTQGSIPQVQHHAVSELDQVSGQKVVLQLTMVTPGRIIPA